jgi:8-oxo-dGTP pyrophosphatase MutT (NUDIX family)
MVGEAVGLSEDPRWFQVTVKGIVRDERGAVLMLRERSGVLDLPGGRLERGETLAECLERECREEMGVGCRVVDRVPRYAWTATDKDGVWRVVLCYAIELASFDFAESDECAGYEFVSKDDLASRPVSPQTRELARWL